MVVKLIKIICDINTDAKLNGHNVLCVFMIQYIEQVRVCVPGVSKIQSKIHEVVKEQVLLVSRFRWRGPRRTPLPPIEHREIPPRIMFVGDSETDIEKRMKTK